MNPKFALRKAGFGLAVLLIAGANAVMARAGRSGDPAVSDSCDAPEYRAFDFWIGDWDVYEADKPSATVAHVRVERILGGCVLREDYQDNNGLKGRSFSIYDSSRKVWHQSWVTNRGQLLLLNGNIQRDES